MNDNKGLYQALVDPGYVVFKEVMPTKEWFARLYETFDKVIDKLDQEQENELRVAALTWLSEGDNNSYFCGTPPSFRDRSGMEGKRNKLYLQYCLEFANSEVFANTWIAKQPEMIDLLRLVKEVEIICASLFERALKAIISKNPSLSNYYDFKRPLPIVMKLVRYNKDNSRFATDPHYDKSALSIIVDADDEEVNWKIGKGTYCLLSEMIAPFQYPKNVNEPNHCILFSGLCLKQAGVDLLPAPHYVMPVVKKQFRHSIIAFLLVPNLPDTSELDTTASFIQDIMKEIS